MSYQCPTCGAVHGCWGPRTLTSLVTTPQDATRARRKPDGYAAFGTCTDKSGAPQPIRIPGYDGASEEEVLQMVHARARKEGFRGSAVERMTSLGWWIAPFFAEHPLGICRSGLQAESSAELWCLHVMGPDDVHAAPSREAAELVAEQVNAYFASMDLDVNPNAVAALWPHSPESHAESLKEWEQVWTTPQDAAPGVQP